jgi:hypothetical protein
VNRVHSIRRERLPTRHAPTHTRDVASTNAATRRSYWAANRHIGSDRPGTAVARPTFMHSSNTRGKAAVLPWMAALIIGATAHGGWLIHELHHADAQPRMHTAARCRHAPPEIPTTEPVEDLDLWVQQTRRHVYAIDRRMFDHLALTQVDTHALERLQSIGDGALGAVELRNIRRGTPLYLLGLRNGDRLLAIATRGHPAIEWVTVTIARRGQPLALVYDII